MVRGLALRQGLLALNVGLALVLTVVVFLAARVILRPRIQPVSISEPDLARVSAPLLGGPAHTRAEYDELMKRGLFGDAGRFKRGEKPAAPIAPAPDAAVVETKLPLKLSGTALSRGSRVLSAAIIEVREGGTKTATFYPNDEVIDNVFLREVRPQEVILDNRRNNTTESLKILWVSEISPGGAAAPGQLVRQPFAAAAPGAGARLIIVDLDRAAITKKLEDEYARVASTMNVKVVNDESGRPKGITTDNIENYQVAQELGLKNGDVLVSLNNEPVDSRERAVEVLQKYRNASMFRVGLMRDGQLQYKTYRVR
jgi:type II secretory pathway component PulC